MGNTEEDKYWAAIDAGYKDVENDNKLLDYTEDPSKYDVKQFKFGGKVYSVYKVKASTSTNTGGTSTTTKKKTVTQTTPKCSDYPSTPFKTQAEGDEFRKWVIGYKPDYAKSIDLWASYKDYNNCTIRKAYSALGDVYNNEKLGISTSTATLGVSADKQKALFDLWIEQNKLEDGILLQLDSKKSPYTDSFGLSLYEYCYVKKYNAVRDKNGNLTSIGGVVPVKSKADVVYSDDTLITLLFYDFKYAYLNKDYKPEFKNFTLKWSLGVSKLFTLESTKIKFITEQDLDFSSIVSSSQNVGADLSGGLSIGSQSSGSGVVSGSDYQKQKEDEKKEESKTKESAKVTDSKTVCQALTNRQDQLRCLFGFIDEEGKTFSPSVNIKTMNQDQTRGIAGEGSLQYAIDNFGARSYYFDDYNEMMDMEGLPDSKLKYPSDYSPSEYAGDVIDTTNFSGLIPLAGTAADQYKEFTFGKFLATNSTIELFLIQSGRQAVENELPVCADEPDVIREKLMKYLGSAFLGTRKTPTDSENLTYLNRCIATNKLNDKNFTPFTVTDFPNVNTDRLPFNLLRKELKLVDIERLIKGNEIGGIKLKAQFQDRDFGTSEALYENTIKKHITEAVKTKNKVKIKNTIITEILLEMKR